MKQIPLLQGKALLIELPEGAKSPRIETNQSVIHYGQDLNWDINGGEKSYWMDETERVSLPPGNWRIIEMLSEVTEEQANEIVSKVINGQHFQNYAFTSPVNRWVKTAIESLESSILAEGYYLDENPIPEPDISRYPNDDWIADYNNAHSRVLDRSRCLLLGKAND